MKTGSMAELAITVAIVALCTVVIYTRREVPGTFIPLFYRYDRLYQEGLIDGHEWRQHHFRLHFSPENLRNHLKQASGSRKKPEIPQQSQHSQPNHEYSHLDTSAVDNFPQPRQI